jgi:hypothetical protein
MEEVAQVANQVKANDVGRAFHLLPLLFLLGFLSFLLLLPVVTPPSLQLTLYHLRVVTLGSRLSSCSSIPLSFSLSPLSNQCTVYLVGGAYSVHLTGWTLAIGCCVAQRVRPISSDPRNQLPQFI